MRSLLSTTAALLLGATIANSQEMNNLNTNYSLAPQQELALAQQWDKTFPQSEKVDHRKVTFVNRYGITLVADMYTPKEVEGKLKAIAISGPFGAVKEQVSGLYAQHLAERRLSDSSRLTLPLPVRVGGCRVAWLLLISIQRILWQP